MVVLAHSALTQPHVIGGRRKPALFAFWPYLRDMKRHQIILSALVVTIVVAHIFMWSSDRMPTDVKIRLTVINALGWGIVLLPAWAVGKWLDARQRLNADQRRLAQKSDDPVR